MLRLSASSIRGIVHIGLAFGLLLGFLSLLDLAHPKVFFTVDRVVIWEYFKLGWEPLPYLLALATAPLLISYDRRFGIGSLLLLAGLIFLTYPIQLMASLLWTALVVAITYKRVRWRETVSYLSLIVLVITGVVFSFLLLFPAIPWSILPLNDVAFTWTKTYATLQPVGMLSFVVLPFALFVPLYLDAVKRRGSWDFLYRWSDRVTIDEFLEGRLGTVLLILALVLSAYLSVYSYFGRLNPLLQPTGVDIGPYTHALEAIVQSNDPVRVCFVNYSDRPLFYLALYGIQRVTGLQPFRIVEVAPVFLIVGLVASYYYFSKKLLDYKSMAILVAFLTVAGIQTTVGLYSSYQANMAALILANIMVSAALTWDEGPVKYGVIGLISFLMPLIHPYTSLYYGAILVVALSVEAWRKRETTHLFTVLVVIVSAILSVPYTYMMTSGQSVSPIERATGLGGSIVDFKNIFSYLGDTVQLFTTTYSGFIANSIFILLALFGLTRLLKLEIYRIPKTFLAISVLALLPAPFVGSMMASRLLFNFPLQIYAAIGIYSTKDRYLAVALIGLCLTFALQAVFNFGTLPFPG